MPTTVNALSITFNTTQLLGATTLNLLDSTNYMVEDSGINFGVARQLITSLGNSTQYEDVLCEITVNVYGATGAAVAANLEALMRMAEPSQRRDYVGYVTCQPAGSVAATAFVSYIKNVEIDLPPNWLDQISIGHVESVKIKFIRQGLWRTPTGAAGTIAGHIAANLGAGYNFNYQTLLVPTTLSFDIQWANGIASQAVTFDGGYVVSVSDAYRAYYTVDANSLTLTNASSLSDATTSTALGGSTVQIAANAASPKLSTTNQNLPAGRYLILATLRTLDPDWKLQFSFGSAHGQTQYFSPKVGVETLGTGNPYVKNLGIVSFPDEVWDMTIYPTRPVTTGTKLEIDQIFLIRVSDPLTRVLKVGPRQIIANDGTGVTLISWKLNIDAAIGINDTPDVYFSAVYSNTDQELIQTSYSGDAAIVSAGDVSTYTGRAYLIHAGISSGTPFWYGPCKLFAVSRPTVSLVPQ